MKLLSRGFGAALLTALATQTFSAQPMQATGPAAPPPVSITVHLDHSIGPLPTLFNWFGYDEANYTTMPNGRDLLRELHDLSPVPVQIRVHHLLTSGDGVPELKWSSTGVYREDAGGHPVYDFKLLDGIFDQFKAAGVRPMVELGFMPRDLAADLPARHEPYQVHYPQSTISGASNNPPKDYARWRELIRSVTAHLVDRYGQAAVAQWYFEVWNEPDIDYWHASPQEYFKLYDFAVSGVRAALPGARVGGPASTGPANPHAASFLQSFLTHVQSNASAVDGGPIPLDFISFHAKGRPHITGGHVQMGLGNELLDVDRGLAIVASFPSFRRLPIILSEADPEGCAACSSKVNPANNYRNGTLYPAYTAAAYKGILELGQRRNANLLAMLSWSFEFEGKDSFEGFRSLATNGVDKPILNLFRMLALMPEDRVLAESTGMVPLDRIVGSGVRQTADIDSLAGRGDHKASVLVWHYHDSADPAPAAPARLILKGLPAGLRRVLLTEYRIDDTHSNAYTVWQAMGSPPHPTASQTAILKERDGLELLHSPAWLDVVDGQVEIDDSLPRQSVTLLNFTWR